MDDRAVDLRKKLMTAFGLSDADVPGDIETVNPLCMYDAGSIDKLPIALAYAFEMEDGEDAIRLLHHFLWPLGSWKTRAMLSGLSSKKRESLLSALVFAFENIGNLGEDPDWETKLKGSLVAALS